MTEELDAGGGKIFYKDYISVINNYLIPYFGKQKVDSINTRKLTKFACWRDMKTGTAKEEVGVRGLRNKIKDYQRLKEELGKVPKPFKVKKSTNNTHNSALNRVFDKALFRGLRDLNDSIKHLTLKVLFSKQLDVDVFSIRNGYTPTTEAFRGSFRQYLKHAGILRDTNGVKNKKTSESG
jgi:hypothetical protein